MKLDPAVEWLETRFERIWLEAGEIVDDSFGVRFFRIDSDLIDDTIHVQKMFELKDDMCGAWNTPYRWNARGISGGWTSFDDGNHCDMIVWQLVSDIPSIGEIDKG